MDTVSPCQYLTWDSEFFGYRIARATSERLTEAEIENVMQWCQAQHIDCLYFLADSDDRTTIQLAEVYRFHLVDIRLTLEIPTLSQSSAPDNRALPQIRLATLEDIPALRTLARSSHRDTRFYHDPHFSEARATALYETWIEKSCQGYAEAVLVAGPPSHPVGYISCHLSPQGEGSLGLVAISPEVQGQGLGQQLVQSALNWFEAQEATKVQVVTQGRNVRAQRLYQRCGFLSRSLQLWYHWWSPTVQATDREG